MASWFIRVFFFRSALVEHVRVVFVAECINRLPVPELGLGRYTAAVPESGLSRVLPEMASRSGCYEKRMRVKAAEPPYAAPVVCKPGSRGCPGPFPGILGPWVACGPECLPWRAVCLDSEKSPYKTGNSICGFHVPEGKYLLRKPGWGTVPQGGCAGADFSSARRLNPTKRA